MTLTNERIAIGIDVGGTAIKGGVVSESGNVIAQIGIPTSSDGGVEPIVGQIGTMVSTLIETLEIERSRIVGLGVGVPGLVNYDDGGVIDCANLRGWKGAQIAQLLDDRTGFGVSMENDANAAALAEARIGAGRGADAMVLLTLGTGVGSGIVIDNKLWHGYAGTAGEIGHTIVRPGGRQCSCGQRGCLEAYASASATARSVVEAVEAGSESVLADRVKRGEALSSVDVVEAAMAGDALANRVWEESCELLAIAAINLQHTLNPKCIVLGGGMSAAGAYLLDNVVRQCSAMMSPRLGKVPDLRLAELGNDAGFIGAALNAFRGSSKTVAGI